MINNQFNSNDYSDNNQISADTLKYYIDNNISQPQFRIYVLYPDETINYEIPQEDIQLGGSYNENYQNGQRCSLSFSLYNENGNYTPNINTFWAGTRLRLDVGIKVSDSETYWFQKGIFVINSVTPSLSPSSKIVSVSAGDKFTLLDGSTGKLSSTYEIPADTDIESLILDILHTNIGDGYLLDPKNFIFNSAFRGKKTQISIAKNAGETLGSILLDVASQLSAEVYYNEMGTLVFVPINEVTLDKDKPLLYSFETSRGDISGLDFSFDYNSIINRIIVIGTSSSGGTFTSEAVNSDPGSPLCYQRIGYRTGDIINDSNIYSMQLAEERADYELRKQLILKSSTSASVIFNPLLKVNNIIAISDEFFNLNHERFLLQSISYSLDYSNQMSITFSNLSNLPFVVS